MDPNKKFIQVRLGFFKISFVSAHYTDKIYIPGVPKIHLLKSWDDLHFVMFR